MLAFAMCVGEGTGPFPGLYVPGRRPGNRSATGEMRPLLQYRIVRLAQARMERYPSRLRKEPLPFFTGRLWR